MRIAILPIYTEYYRENNLFLGSTSLAYLMNYLEKYFPDDLIYPVPDLKNLYRTDPDIVGISAPYSQEFNNTVNIAREIKNNLKIPIILGGQHITYLPKTLPQVVDIGVIGEGEETFRDLISLYKDHKEFNDKLLSSIKGIVFHSKGQKIMTEKRKPIQNIDNIPCSRKFFYQMPGDWFATLITGRGQTSNALFSNKADKFEKEVRLHSAERLIEDIIDIITFHPNQKIIPIVDDFLLYDMERFRQFTRIIGETELYKHVKFSVGVKPKELTEELCFVFKHVLGIYNINIPFISPIPRIQQDLKEDKTNRKELNDALKLCYRHGFNTNVYFFNGSPTETKEELAKSYWIVREYKRKYDNAIFNYNTLIPYPGSEAWGKAIMKRLVNENLQDWSILNCENLNDKSPILSPLHSKKEFLPISEEMKDLNVMRQGGEIHTLLKNKKIFYPSVMNMLEYIVKTHDIDNVLQITEHMFFNLKTIFNEDSIKIDTLNYSSLLGNKDLLKNTEKKYDAIALVFTLDILSSPELILDFCKKSLKPQGTLILSFFNCKNLTFIEEILYNKDISKLFYTFKKLNYFSLGKMVDLLKKYDFIVKKYDPVIFPSLNQISASRSNVINTIRYYFKYEVEEYTTLSYTFLCRNLK